MSAPEVQMPGRDVLNPVPRPPGSMITLQRLGQPCGVTNAPPNFFAGKCERHLECVRNPFIPDGTGVCKEKGNERFANQNTKGHYLQNMFYLSIA